LRICALRPRAEKAGRGLISEAETLAKSLSDLLAWEKVKRRREIFSSVCCYSLLGALVLLPFHVWLPNVSRGWTPLVIFLLLSPVLFFQQRWRKEDSARALARLDRALRLDERAVTAWEILPREKQSGPETFVVTQAAERLRGLEPKTLFERQLSWRDYSILPLGAFWLALFWLGVGSPVNGGNQMPRTVALAHQLREFSRDLQDTAQREGLSESLKMGRELEKTAQKGIEQNSSDEKFKNELAALANKLDAMRKPTAAQQPRAVGESDQTLKDLKAELQAARELLNAPEGANRSGDLDQNMLQRLSLLPQLKKQFDQAGPAFNQDTVKSFLDKLDKEVTGEMDRRTLLEAQQFLDRLMKDGQGEKSDTDAQVAGRQQRDSPTDGDRAQTRSNLPGKEPGKKEGVQPLPDFPAGAPAHVKGMIGEGGSNGLVFKAKPSAGKTEIPQEELLANYRRQAEAELNTERVPAELKETIRNYFLSLRPGEGNR